MRPVAFAAPSGWQMAAVHLELLQIDPGRREVSTIFQSIPLELRSAPVPCRSTARQPSVCAGRGFRKRSAPSRWRRIRNRQLRYAVAFLRHYG
jgi:hypothetical protein